MHSGRTEKSSLKVIREEQEKRGQENLCNSELLPTEIRGKEKLEANVVDVLKLNLGNFNTTLHGFTVSG